MPKFSIITINRNNASGLSGTIMSVVSQTFRDYEYIIIDGASEDESVDVIKRCIGTEAPVIWKSEPDGGIYNAMNKGVAMASGDFLLFLNSGDKFADKDVLKAVDSLQTEEDILVGRVNVVKKGRIVATSPILKDSDLSLYKLFVWGLPHQAAFIRRKLLNDNPYDENLKINSDWKFFVQEIVLKNVNVYLMPLVVADYDGEGLSSKNMDILLDERRVVFQNMFPRRMVEDYLAVVPHYYEIIRIAWLLKHPVFYKVYRAWTSAGMRMIK